MPLRILAVNSIEISWILLVCVGFVSKVVGSGGGSLISGIYCWHMKLMSSA